MGGVVAQGEDQGLPHRGFRFDREPFDQELRVDPRRAEAMDQLGAQPGVLLVPEQGPYRFASPHGQERATAALA